MKAVMYRGIGQVAVEEIAKPEMTENDYLVEVLYSGLCGTDIKTFKQGHRMFTPPCVLGHEFSGRIIAAGANMDASLVGKKVAVAPYIGCGHCEMCLNGHEELCSTWPKPYTEGAFTELLTVSAEMAKGGMLVLDDDADEKIMTLAEPFACILNSMGKSQVKAGQNALVIGAGPMGLLHIEGLKMAGAKNILVSEYNDTRCKIAEAMGAKTINPGKTPDVKAEIKKLLNGENLHQVFVCVGIPSVVEDAMLLVSKGGTVNIFGGLKTGCTITIDPNIIHYSEVKVVGTFGFSSKNYLDAAHSIAEGKVDLSSLITHEFKLEEADKAFDLGAHPTDDVVKIVVKMK